MYAFSPVVLLSYTLCLLKYLLDQTRKKKRHYEGSRNKKKHPTRVRDLAEIIQPGNLDTVFQIIFFPC